MKDKKTRTLKPLGAFLLALVMVLTHVLGAMDVYAAGINVKKPTVNPVFYDATTISGGNLAKYRDKVTREITIATVHVTLKGKDGTVKATLSDNPTKGTTWSVTLPAGKKVEEGDTVTVYQQIGEDKSPEVTATAKPSKASTVTLTMPTGEIWIEQTSSSIVNADEQAEAVKMLKDANTAIAGDIKSVKFSINGTEHAYYEVTYDDDSTSGKVEATNLQIKKVTETSRSPEIGSITVVDKVVKGKLPGPGPFDGIKVELILKVKKEKSGDFCTDKGCKIDKDSSKPIVVPVESDGSFSYTLQSNDKLELDQIVGVSVKEPRKFVSCSTTTVKPAKVEKIEVKDPRKLTSEDKKAIDDAIRKAYTVNGVSKLPDGTGYYEEVPAVIQIDDSGNVKIFSGNDVAGTWDSEGTFVPEKNDDGSVKLNKGAEPKITIPAKDLVKNIAPKSPAIKVDTDKGEVTITPPAYKDPGDDTDLLSYTITYKDNSGAEKNVTATRDLKTNKWSGTGVDADTGVITLNVEDVKVEGTITATAKDNGGLEGDTDKLDSDQATKTLETATVSYDRNGGTGDMDSKKLNKGSKYSILNNDFTAPENKEFDGWTVNGEDKKVGDEITVTKDTTVTAKWKDSMVDVTFAGNGGGGSMDKATVKKGSTYKLPDNKFKAPENKEFDGWVVNGEAKKVGDEITVNENTTVTAKWKAKGKPEDSTKPSDPKKPSAPAITWRGLWYLGEKTEPAKAVQEMEIGRHYKYLYGYVDKTVRPEGMITRSEAAALIARLAELDMTDKTKPNFKDTPSAWYNSAINIMVKKDLMFGDKNGNFRPNEPITRGEFARALYYIDKKNDKVAPFADVKGHEFEAAINQAYGNDRIAGYPDGSFKPNAYIQRAEAARILNQYANRNVNIPGMEGVKKDLIRFTDINENHWAYCEVMEAANSHEYQRVKGSQVETWLRILDIKADWE